MNTVVRAAGPAHLESLRLGAPTAATVKWKIAMTRARQVVAIEVLLRATLVLANALLMACSHAEATIGTRDLLALVRTTPIDAGHTACAVFDADGTLWDFDLSGTLTEQTLVHKRASDAGLPALNASLQSFGLPAATDIYAAAQAMTKAYETKQLYAIGETQGLDEDAVNVRIWPQYNWLYVDQRPAELEQLATQLMVEQAYDARIFAGMRAVIGALRERQFHVYVISGGVHEFVVAGAARLGFSPVEAHGLKLVVQDGRLTPQVVAPVPYKQGKATLALQLCGGKPLFAFGDSVATGDAAMLQLAAIPVAVRPHGRHLTAAHTQQMRIYEHPETGDAP